MYYGQKRSSYADCMPRALTNACVLLGLPHIVPDTDAWESIVDFAGARYGGAVVSVEKMAVHLGLRAVQVVARGIGGLHPLLLTVRNPEVGTAFHFVLVTRWFGHKAEVVDYRVDEGPLLETLLVSFGEPPPRTDRWGRLYIPPPPNDGAWLLRRAIAVG